MRNTKLFIYIVVILCLQLFLIPTFVFARDILPNVNISVGESGDGSSTSIQLITLILLITLAPTLIIMLTSFTRIIISLHFLRAALGTQQMPPSQILLGIALVITLFIMSPTLTKINENAFTPYSQGKISEEKFLDEAMKPMREFMFTQIKDKDLELFTNLAGIKSYDTPADVPNSVLIPSFVLGEVTKGFIIGFLIYIPFIVIDMVVSSVLMAMGMMMLPPALISAPFKIIFFIMVDGWNLIIGNIIRTFTSG